MNLDQKIVKDFVKKNDLDSPIEYKFIDLVSELGEIAKELNLITNYGKLMVEVSSGLLEEIGDIYYSLLILANYFGADLSVLLEKAINKYKERLKQGSPGSEK
ncbi:MAG: nucleotide pyrophosphohydrolase [Candidatus Hodarchaeales archaeon]|jgi:NTP pyrophosphatase (non-canonical NTP hydrolase)